MEENPIQINPAIENPQNEADVINSNLKRKYLLLLSIYIIVGSIFLLIIGSIATFTLGMLGGFRSSDPLILLTWLLISFFGVIMIYHFIVDLHRFRNIPKKAHISIVIISAFTVFLFVFISLTYYLKYIFLSSLP
jgi:hypothetical protein